MRLRILIGALTLSLFVGLALLVSLLNGALERHHRLDNLRLEAQAIATVVSAFLRHHGPEHLESQRASLERALAATRARSVFLVAADAPSRPLAVWLDRPPASLLDPVAPVTASPWGWFDPEHTPRTANDESLRLHLDADPAQAWFALVTTVDPNAPPDRRIGVVLRAEDAVAAMQRQWHQAVLAVLGAAVLGVVLALYLNWMLGRDLDRLGRRLQARIEETEPERSGAAPWVREFAELDRAVGLMDSLERTAIARELAEAPAQALGDETGARRRVLLPRVHSACRDWEILTTLVGAAEGAFQVQVECGCSLHVVLGRVCGDVEACKAATWWERALAWGLGPAEVWLPDLRARFVELFGPETEVRIERFPRPLGARSAEAHPGLNTLSDGLLCQTLLEPVESRLAYDWCANAAPGCELEQLADELDRLLSEAEGPGGALLLARLRTPPAPSGTSD